MNRRDKVLRHIAKQGVGLEIGPSYDPIPPKRAGFKVHVLDVLTREELLAKCREEPVSLENIEEVDFLYDVGRSRRATRDTCPSISPH
jgi:hypothetical protein